MALSLFISLVLATPDAAVAQPRAAVPAVQPIGNVAPARVLILEAFSSPLTAPALSKGAAPALLHPALDERMAVFLQRTAAASPKSAQAVQAVPKAAGAVAVLAVANRELASFTPEQLDAMSPEELDNLAGRIMDGAGAPRPAVDVLAAAPAPAPTADLPPTSLKRNLSDSDIQRVLAAVPAERPHGFDDTGAVPTILSASREELPDLFSSKMMLHGNRIFFDMYHALSGVVNGPGSNEERASLALALQDRYAEFFQAARSSPIVPHAMHVAAGRVLHRLLKSGALIEELFHAREIADKLKELDRLLAEAPALKDIPPMREDGVSQQWKIPSRLPDNERIRDDTQKTTFTLNMKRLADELNTTSFNLDQSLKRAALAKTDVRFSGAFHQARSQDLTTVTQNARHIRARVAGTLTAYIGNRLINQFIAPKKVHPEVAQPDNRSLHPGLELTLSGDDFILKARFATPIVEPELRQFVKSSIEDYWHGSFTDAAGLTYSFRTEVSIRALKPGEDSSPEELRLTEASLFGDHAGADGFALSRDNGRWHTPAHEFGHVLGLPDEYTIEYDVRRRTVRESQPKNSLMSSNLGVALPRHLALVVSAFTGER